MQARGRFIADHRHDVWALAVTALEALSAQHPFARPPPPAAGPGSRDSPPAQLLRVGRLDAAPRRDAVRDGGLRGFLDGALAVTPAAQRPGGGLLLDAAGAVPEVLLAALGPA